MEKGKKKLLMKKMKRSPDKRYTQARGSFTETFQESQISFSKVRHKIKFKIW